MKLISGTANLPLAEAIASHIQQPDGTAMSLTKTATVLFNDGEIFTEIKENVRGEDVVVIQSTCRPTNDNLMELLIMVDALRLGSARTITAVIPYYGYARQDRKNKPRTPISARLVASMLQTAGVNRVLTMDLHAAQIQGFFQIPVDNMYARPLIIQDLKERMDISNLLIVAPDMGGVPRARSLANKLDVPLAIIDKRRLEPGASEVMNIIGNIQAKDCVLVDDMVDTAGTLCQASDALVEHGAKSVRAYATHGVLSVDKEKRTALSKIAKSSLAEMVFTNTIDLQKDQMGNSTTEDLAGWAKIRYIDVAPFLADAIMCIRDNRSVSSLFDN